ncbi:MAG: hypothetical protein E6K71_09580 [Candidatus Eisenbacteria bacterium]|uniref:Uncharacterized protein n=1 Tax=Eiseniibacteriota bacterium TaxID=2212470 RepID=A0A538S894_UNCEI|nr:MAG: hypothetical protein E6K71_09580 [Candidatus Eisenbacteria bacterium]
MVLALLAPIAVSCTKTNDEFILVPVDGVVRLRDGGPLGGIRVGFFAPGSRIVPLAPPPHSPLAPEGWRAGQGQIFENPIYATTDMQGHFRVALRQGRYEVWIGAASDSGIMSQSVPDLTLISSPVTLDLRYAGYRLSGRLIGPGGAALTNGSVFVLSRTNTARASVVAGSYSLLLPADTLAIWANPETVDSDRGIPRVKREAVILSSDSTLDLSVDGFVVTGTVTGPGGVPLDGGLVSATAATASAYSRTAADGTYRVYLPGMEYFFRVDPGPGRDSIGIRQYPNVLIDSDRTLDFDLSGAPTARR